MELSSKQLMTFTGTPLTGLATSSLAATTWVPQTRGCCNRHDTAGGQCGLRLIPIPLSLSTCWQVHIQGWTAGAQVPKVAMDNWQTRHSTGMQQKTNTYCTGNGGKDTVHTITVQLHSPKVSTASGRHVADPLARLVTVQDTNIVLCTALQQYHGTLVSEGPESCPLLTAPLLCRQKPCNSKVQWW